MNLKTQYWDIMLWRNANSQQVTDLVLEKKNPHIYIPTLCSFQVP
jgi:hypothetical protein